MLAADIDSLSTGGLSYAVPLTEALLQDAGIRGRDMIGPLLAQDDLRLSSFPAVASVRAWMPLLRDGGPRLGNHAGVTLVSPMLRN